MKLERTKISHNRTRYHWTQELYDYVMSEHWNNNRTLGDIAKELNIPYSSLQVEMERAGLSRRNGSNARKYDVDMHYFDMIDTPARAYWLGYLYADGYVHTECAPYNVVFTQTEKDSISVYKLAETLKYTGPIRQEYNKYSQNAQYRLDVHSKILVNGLESAGCIHCKPNRKFPSTDVLPQELQWHFIRGLYDGDGCLNCSLNGSGKSLHYQMELHGSYALLEQIGMLIDPQQFHIRKIKHVSDEVDSFEMRIWRHEIIDKAYSRIYQDIQEGIYLDRKYQTYLKFQQYYISRVVQ